MRPNNITSQGSLELDTSMTASSHRTKRKSERALTELRIQSQTSHMGYQAIPSPRGRILAYDSQPHRLMPRDLWQFGIQFNYSRGYLWMLGSVWLAPPRKLQGFCFELVPTRKEVRM